MARTKRNESSFHGILFFILLLLSFILMQTADSNAGRALRGSTAGAFRSLLTPFSFIPRSFTLWEENAVLQQELMRLNQELLRTEQAVRENERLHELLELPQRPDYSLIPATVLAHEQAGFTHRLLINRGSSSSIEDHDPVVCAEGLIGKVVEVDLNSAQVILLNDPSFRARVRLSSSGVEGMLAYDYDRHVYLMKNVPLSTELILGDTVFTSGLESLFPPGLTIGMVSEFETTTGLFWRVVIQPLPELTSLTTVGVLHRNATHEMD
ncbi:MAG: rod shape-determining protein MreC [Candidatus Delongbacteria bacterium]|nr:rod shape-determining protein MreC [bacterium]MBL7032968.1 rod shape-determining protein MreC [Candidatus Delongbacteria bacterium]